MFQNTPRSKPNSENPLGDGIVLGLTTKLVHVSNSMKIWINIQL